MTSPWIVHKFGGSSLAAADRYRHVGRVLALRAEPRRAVVVSAMGGVTDDLVRVVEEAARRDSAYRERLEAIRLRHHRAVADLVPPEAGRELLAHIDRDVSDVAEVLHATWLLRSHSPQVTDLISGYGEVWSAQILAAHLSARGERALWLDARSVLVVHGARGGPEVDWDVSRARLDEWVRQHRPLPQHLVVTGYVAATPDGVPTTLGRNGSDYSASIFAVLLDAPEVHIWTDVDGVMSADPRLVPDAVTLEELSYHEAMELAYFGAKVVHPRTMAPVVQREIPIYIRNTFRPELPGTRIHLRGASASVVKGFATIEGIALVNVEGTGMVGVPGTAQRLFGALREAGVSVVMISQGSSEHSICFAVPAELALQTRDAVEHAFFAERHLGQIQTVEINDRCCVLAAVGDAMVGHPGVAAKFFGALGKAGVNIRAIAQGASERNISVVIDQADAARALRAVHSGFFLSPQTLSIGVIGTGVVGGALLHQLAREKERLRQESGVDLRVRAIATSRGMLLDEGQIDLSGWRAALETVACPVDPAALAEHVHAPHLPHAVLIDCTASEAVSRHYPEWLARGIHVITPNKRAGTAPWEDFRKLRRASRTAGTHYLYETTVGAGLPILQTLRDLVQTGDEVIQVEGILSGTLSFLFNSLDGSTPFSSVLAEARARGYTEPDPRDDLSGTDVARKVVILAREMGLSMELSDVRVEGLVPHELSDVPVDDFLEQLPAWDERIETARREAAAAGQVLRYVGLVDRNGTAHAGLRAYPVSHPFARVQLTDNVVLFRTQRYDTNPLVVQGPGAGPDVTAGGVFADLLRLAAYLGATL